MLAILIEFIFFPNFDVFPLFSLFQEEERIPEECKRQKETARIEAEEEALETVGQKAAWSVKQPLCVLQMHVVIHCRCLMYFKYPNACVFYNETCP